MTEYESFLRGETVVIIKGKWKRSRYEILQRGITQMEKDFRSYNYHYFGNQLREPVVDLDDGPARYNPFTWKGSLFVPIQIAETKPWRMVQECMLQQMVNQKIWQDHKILEGRLHQRLFQEICQQPKIRLALSMTYGMPGFSNSPVSEEEARVRARIERLLSLGTSENRHEAEAALAEAHRLMLKHNIDLSLHMDPKAQHFGIRHVGPYVIKVHDVDSQRANLLREHFFVEIIWAHAYDIYHDRQAHVLELIGTPSNLDMAVYVYEFLEKAAQRAWDRYKMSLGVTQLRGRVEFLTGVITGFRSKMAVQARKEESAGLVWLGKKDLKEFYTTLYPKTSTMERHPSPPKGAHYLAGLAAGRQIEIHKPIEERPTSAPPRSRYIESSLPAP